MLIRATRWKRAFLLIALSVSWAACAEGDTSSVTQPVSTPDVTVDVTVDAAVGDSTVPGDVAALSDTASETSEDTGTPKPDVPAVADSSLKLDTTPEDVPEELPESQDSGSMEVAEETTTEPGPITVLFIGNSYTFGNNLPDLVQEWAEAIGVELSTEMIAKGGALLEQHAVDPQTLATIAEMAPTYVVLQGQSYVPLVAPFTFYTGAAPLAQAAHAAGSTPVFFETWARQEGHAMYSNELAGYDPASMQATLREAYQKAATDNDGIYAPVGDAWEVSLGANPDLILHSGDGSHAAMTGSYLAAAVFVGLLGDVEISAVSNMWTPNGVDEADAALLRDAAQQALNAP